MVLNGFSGVFFSSLNRRRVSRAANKTNSILIPKRGPDAVTVGVWCDAT